MAGRRIALIGGIVALLGPGAASAIAPSVNSPSVGGKLARTLRASAIAHRDSAAIAVDLTTGETLFSQNANVALAPASNEKLTVTYGALVELGPTYRFITAVLGEGHQVGDVWQGRLVLKGFGDPTLSTSDLRRLAKKIYDLGIRRVTGHIVGDASWFDDHVMAPGWDPSYYGSESAPLSALVVNRGFKDDWLLARNPALSAAALFGRMLQAEGIQTRDAIVGTVHAETQTLASVESHKLARLLRLMDADSDNYTAEMVLKAIAAEETGIGSTAVGAKIVRRDLAAAGIPLKGSRIVDGSGLSRYDRVTARELSALLLVFWRNPVLRPIVQNALAVAGETGTLEHRLGGEGTRGIVRGKTGTTQIASALSGYIGERFAFVLLQNGHPVNWSAAHAVQDQFVKTLAAQKRL